MLPQLFYINEKNDEATLKVRETDAETKEACLVLRKVQPHCHIEGTGRAFADCIDPPFPRISFLS